MTTTRAAAADVRPLEINVSIINYRTGDMTVRCAASALEALAADGIRGRVTIVDNFSDDGSAERIADWLAGLPADAPARLVRSPSNTGFSGGHNIGMDAAEADGGAEFHLLLNSDALVRPGALGALLRAARAAPDAGIVAPRLEWEDGTPQISSFRIPTAASELIRGAETGPVTRLLRRRDVPLEQPPRPEDIEWVSFACVLLRDAALREAGRMDEGYFLYFEDIDMCWRIRRAGWRILHEPEARVVHLRGGSAPVKTLAAARRRLPAYYYASRTRLLYLTGGRAGLLAANLAWHLGRGLAMLRALAGKPVPRANAKEARDIWINFADPLGDPRRPG